MLVGFWNSARANKENILYTIVTIFLLERVRRGWNRIERRGTTAMLDGGVIERRQQGFLFRAALLYALPLLIPTVKYIYRSIAELSQVVSGLHALSSIWLFAAVVLATEVFLAIVIYNLLGIYVERMNAALGFFRRIGRSVVDGSRVAVQASGNAGRGAVRRARDAAAGAYAFGRRALSGAARAPRAMIARRSARI